MILAVSKMEDKGLQCPPPPPSEPAASYLNTSYKFFVLAKVWREALEKERRAGLEEKPSKLRRRTLKWSSTQSQLERRGLKEEPSILDKENQPASWLSPLPLLKVIGFH